MQSLEVHYFYYAINPHTSPLGTASNANVEAEHYEDAVKLSTMPEAGHSQGFLVPPWYKESAVPDLDMNIVSIFWGFSLSLAVFTAKKAIRQSMRSWKQRRRVSAYIAMVWGHWVANVLPSFVVWLHIWGTISQSLWLSLFIGVCFFNVGVSLSQIQLVFQIIINRIALLMVDRVQARRLKWGAFAITLFFGVTVSIIWVPANLQISEKWERINGIWDRFKQVTLLIMDVCLNGYFLYIVRHSLISNGLTKYNNLFKYNVLMVFTVVALDVGLIGLISLPVKTAYLQFQTIVYLTRLNIEMENAELIRKILKTSNNGNLSAFSGTNCATLTSNPTQKHRGRFWPETVAHSVNHSHNQNHNHNHGGSDEGDVAHVELGPMLHTVSSTGEGSSSTSGTLFERGLQKTVVAEVHSEALTPYQRSWAGSRTSSTTPLRTPERLDGF